MSRPLEQGLLPAASPGESEGIPPPPVQKGKLRPTPRARLVWPRSQPSCLICRLEEHPWTQFPPLEEGGFTSLSPWEQSS